MRVSPSFLETGPGFALVGLRNITITVWGTAATMEHISLFASAGRTLLKRYDRLSNFTVLTHEATLPPAATREALEGLVAASAGRLCRVALVLSGDGFRLSSMRAFLTGLHVAQRRQYKTDTFMTAEPAAEWLVPAHVADTGVEVTVVDALAAIDFGLEHVESQRKQA